MNTHYIGWYMGLIGKGTMTTIPPFSLWFEETQGWEVCKGHGEWKYCMIAVKLKQTNNTRLLVLIWWVEKIQGQIWYRFEKIINQFKYRFGFYPVNNNLYAFPIHAAFCLPWENSQITINSARVGPIFPGGEGRVANFVWGLLFGWRWSRRFSINQ